MASEPRNLSKDPIPSEEGNMEPGFVQLQNPIFPRILVPDLFLFFVFLGQVTKSLHPLFPQLLNVGMGHRPVRIWILVPLFWLEISAGNSQAVPSQEDRNFREDLGLLNKQSHPVSVDNCTHFEKKKKIASQDSSGLLGGVANWHDSPSDCWLIKL